MKYKKKIIYLFTLFYILSNCKKKDEAQSEDFVKKGPKFYKGCLSTVQGELEISYKIIQIGSTKNAIYGDTLIPLTKIKKKCDKDKLKLTGIYNIASLWPYGKIPYIFDESITLKKQEDIKKAMAQWANKEGGSETGLKFIEATSEHLDYLTFKKLEDSVNKVGWSFIGRIGGEQPIYLSDSCTFKNACIQHELGHAIGFDHQHSSHDRDDFIKIQWENIRDEARTQFTKFENSYFKLYASFDFDSVMLYNSFQGSRNGKATYIRKDNDKPIKESGKRPSARDYRSLEKLLIHTKKFFAEEKDLVVNKVEVSEREGDRYKPLEINIHTDGFESFIRYKILDEQKRSLTYDPNHMIWQEGISYDKKVVLGYLEEGTYQIKTEACTYSVFSEQEKNYEEDFFCGQAKTSSFIFPSLDLNEKDNINKRAILSYYKAYFIEELLNSIRHTRNDLTSLCYSKDEAKENILERIFSSLRDKDFLLDKEKCQDYNSEWIEDVDSYCSLDKNLIKMIHGYFIFAERNHTEAECISRNTDFSDPNFVKWQWLKKEGEYYFSCHISQNYCEKSSYFKYQAGVCDINWEGYFFPLLKKKRNETKEIQVYSYPNQKGELYASFTDKGTCKEHGNIWNEEEEICMIVSSREIKNKCKSDGNIWHNEIVPYCSWKKENCEKEGGIYDYGFCDFLSEQPQLSLVMRGWSSFFRESAGGGASTVSKNAPSFSFFNKNSDNVFSAVKKPFSSLRSKLPGLSPRPKLNIGGLAVLSLGAAGVAAGLKSAEAFKKQNNKGSSEEESLNECQTQDKIIETFENDLCSLKEDISLFLQDEDLLGMVFEKPGFMMSTNESCGQK